MFSIEKNVPHPGTHNGRKPYPFAEMEVGDSFFIPAEYHPKITSAASWYGKRNGLKFSIKREGKGFRVWRLA